MTWKITCNGRPLADDIEVADGLRLAHQLIKSSQGVAKYRPSDTPDPVVVTLCQALGHDKTLLEMFGMLAGFKLKLTLSLPVDDGNGGVKQQDILDINLEDLVPEELHFGNVITFTCRTLTPADPKWIEPPPLRRGRRRAS